jgi:hypothetical protein
MIKMGLDNDVLDYITERFDELISLQDELNLRRNKSEKTDISIVMNQKFDEMIVNLKYWGDKRMTNEEVKKHREETQKMLKEFGFPERIL